MTTYNTTNLLYDLCHDEQKGAYHESIGMHVADGEYAGTNVSKKRTTLKAVNLTHDDIDTLTAIVSQEGVVRGAWVITRSENAVHINVRVDIGGEKYALYETGHTNTATGEPAHRLMYRTRSHELSDIRWLRDIIKSVQMVLRQPLPIGFAAVLAEKAVARAMDTNEHIVIDTEEESLC